MSELGTLGAIHLNTPLSAPGLDSNQLILEYLGGGVGTRLITRIQIGKFFRLGD